MKRYYKVFIPSDKKPESFEDWVLLLHGESAKNYICPLKEETDVIVLTKREYYKELYFKQGFSIQQTRLIELEEELRSIRDLLTGEPSEEKFSQAYSIVNKLLRQKLTQQTT